MGALGYLVILVVAGWFGLQIYQTFHAPRCPPGAPPSMCFTPLFTPTDEVDIFVFLTTKPRLRWWTQQGLDELRKVPLWNVTQVAFGTEVAQQETVLPLSAEPLRGVRRNESLLFAHCFLVRAGVTLDEAVDVVRRTPDPGPVAGALGTHAVHASAAVTRWLPHTPRQERKNLLSGLNGTEAGDSVEDDLNAPLRKPAIYRTLPVLGRMAIHPSDLLMWIGTAFAVSAFLPAMPVAAAARHMLAASAAWMAQLRMEQDDKFLQLRRQRAREQAKAQALAEPAQIMPHLPPVLQISLGVDSEEYDARFSPPLLFKEMLFRDDRTPIPDGERDVRYTIVGDSKRRRYVPPLAIDHFGLQLRWWRELDSNESKADPSVPVKLGVSGMHRYSLVETVKQSLKMYLRVGFQERDLEDLQDFFFRYPLHILIIMQVIGFLQFTFTTLAFKNDISFFRGRADYTGLSSRSLATDIVSELVIFLYLYDFDDISRLILFQVGTGCVIDGWKYVRVARLRLEWAYFLPWITHNRGSAESSKELDTEEIDAKGMRYLKLVMYPLSGAWGLYNLYHYQYKSWWSWLISSLADFAYTFSFINMMPQIFINYKLKSVAHMPWRVLMYKFFNTFIDDVFAFFIMSDYMTKKHRFMTLRDDIVFFIFLYQRYIYRVDPTRADEFGLVYGEEAVVAAKAQALRSQQRKPEPLADAPMSGQRQPSGQPARAAAVPLLPASSDGEDKEEEKADEDADEDAGRHPSASAVANHDAAVPQDDEANSAIGGGGAPDAGGAAVAGGARRRRGPATGDGGEGEGPGGAAGERT